MTRARTPFLLSAGFLCLSLAVSGANGKRYLFVTLPEDANASEMMHISIHDYLQRTNNKKRQLENLFIYSAAEVDHRVYENLESTLGIIETDVRRDIQPKDTRIANEATQKAIKTSIDLASSLNGKLLNASWYQQSPISLISLRSYQLKKDKRTLFSADSRVEVRFDHQWAHQIKSLQISFSQIIPAFVFTPVIKTAVARLMPNEIKEVYFDIEEGSEVFLVVGAPKIDEITKKLLLGLSLCFFLSCLRSFSRRPAMLTYIIIGFLLICYFLSIESTILALVTFISAAAVMNLRRLPWMQISERKSLNSSTSLDEQKS